LIGLILLGCGRLSKMDSNSMRLAYEMEVSL
jgi:hypothetical protein